MSKLKDLRLETKLTRGMLADLAEVDVATVRRAEEGKRIQDVKAARIADALSTHLGRTISYRDIGDYK